MSEGPNTTISGKSVAVGNNNTINTYNGLPPTDNLPSGATVEYTCKITIPPKDTSASEKRTSTQETSQGDATEPTQETSWLQQESSPPGRHLPPGLRCSQDQEIGQVQSHLEGQGRQGTTCTSATVPPAPQHQRLTSQASYDGRQPTYSYSQMFTPHAIPLQTTGETTVKRPVFNRSLTDPKGDNSTIKKFVSLSQSLPTAMATTDVSSTAQNLPYCLNPAECPTAERSENVSSPRVLPKSSTFPTPAISQIIKLDNVDISDIVMVKISPKLYIVVSDMLKQQLIYFPSLRGSKNCQYFQLKLTPNSLSPLSDGVMVVGYLDSSSFSVVNLKDKTDKRVNTSRNYTAISITPKSELVACCCGVIDIIDLEGKVLETLTLESPFTWPGYIYSGNKIHITDSKAHTLTRYDRRGKGQIEHVRISMPSGIITLCGVVNTGGKTWIADATGNRILCLSEDQCSEVLIKSDGICKPRGLCLSGDDTLLIAEADGAVKDWKLNQVASTRL